MRDFWSEGKEDCPQPARQHELHVHISPLRSPCASQRQFRWDHRLLGLLCPVEQLGSPSEESPNFILRQLVDPTNCCLEGSLTYWSRNEATLTTRERYYSFQVWLLYKYTGISNPEGKLWRIICHVIDEEIEVLMGWGTCLKSYN